MVLVKKSLGEIVYVLKIKPIFHVVVALIGRLFPKKTYVNIY